MDTILWYKNALKAVFDKTAFVKFKISNKNFKQNIDETNSKQTKIHGEIHTSLKISRKKISKPKSWDFHQMFVISKKKTIPQGMDFNIENL